jgi:quercetin dioxygenase-like cupin family protein
MPIHADLRERAAVATAEMPWTARGALHEKVLEDDDRGRRTWLVYAPAGARIEASGCVDALVLDGALEGAPAGTYLRAPPELVAAAACTAFVKQRPTGDRTPRRADIRGVPFHEHGPGLTVAELHEDAEGRVVLLRFAPGTRIGRHVHELGEEFLVLEGEVADEHGTYGPGAWVRQPPRSAHAIASPRGSLFLTFADHLGPR